MPCFPIYLLKKTYSYSKNWLQAFGRGNFVTSDEVISDNTLPLHLTLFCNFLNYIVSAPRNIHRFIVQNFYPIYLVPAQRSKFLGREVLGGSNYLGMI